MKKALLLGLFLLPGLVLAQAPAGYAPFGGQIKKVEYCECSNNFKLEIGGPRGSDYYGGRPFLYTPGKTTLYSFYQILRRGAWTLGLWKGVDLCVTGAFCSDEEIGLPIEMVGTSM